MRRISLLLALLAGCVPRAEHRDTNTEAAAGPPAPPREEHTAGEVVAGSPRTAEAPPELGRRPGPDWVRVRGAWHWDGVRYVWIAPHWEKRTASYARP